MADVKDFEFDFGDLDAEFDDGTGAGTGNAEDIKYAENKNIKVTNQSGKKGFTFRELGLADYYDDYLTDESKAKFTKDYIKGIDSEAGLNAEAGMLADNSNMSMDEAKSRVEEIRNGLFSEVVARQYLILQADGQKDKIPETKTRAELEAAFNALPGANYSEPRTSKDGKIVYKTQPCIVGEDGKKNHLWFSFASNEQIESLKQFENRFKKMVAFDKTGFYGKLLHFDELKKALAEAPHVKLREFNELRKVTYNSQKLIDLDNAISPYYDKETLENVRKNILESPDVLKAYTAEAQKHFENIDLNAMVTYIDKNGEEKQRKGAVCTGGYASLSQINELVSAHRQAAVEKVYMDTFKPKIVDNLKKEAQKQFFDKIRSAATANAKKEGRNRLSPEEISDIQDKVNNFKLSADEVKKIEEKADTLLNSNRNNLSNIITVQELEVVQDEIKGKVDILLAEEKDRLARRSFEEVAEEIGKLPISESQKFALNFINGVDTKVTENLNRSEAQSMLDKVTEERKAQEVSPQVRAYAEKYHLVKPGEQYTNAKWNEDSKTVPPMDDIRKLAEDLNCMYSLVSRHDYINREPKRDETSMEKAARYDGIMRGDGQDGKKVLTQADFVDIVTTRYKDIDEKKNGPLEKYQMNAGFGMCKNWYEAETGFLRKCCAERLVGALQAEYALSKSINPGASNDGVNRNAIYGIEGCDINKVLDSKLTRDEQLELAKSCREAINKDMAEARKSKINNFENGLIKKDSMGYFVKEALKKVCADCITAEDYVAKTKDPDVVLNGVKDFLASSGKYYITEKNLQYVTKAFMERVPGVIELEGSKMEIEKKINARVDAILKPIAVTGKDSKGTQVKAKAQTNVKSNTGSGAGAGKSKGKGFYNSGNY